jgi:hypothetical protein
MQLSELRDLARARALGFAWDEWAQLGVSATPHRRSAWAADPEALLLFTLEIGRSDPRLFEEVTDWAVVNERLITVQRLRNLCRGDIDLALADAFIASVGRWRPRARLQDQPSDTPPDPTRGEPFFRDLSVPIRRTPDPAFLARGWLKAEVEPSGKSQPPDLWTPIAFAFRLREILGVGARAEAIRALLTNRAAGQTASMIVESAGYSKRNVQEALSSLQAAGVLEAAPVANHLRYDVDRDRWAGLFDLTAAEFPEYRPWPQLLFVVRSLVRWLENPRLDELSVYMRASQTRDLVDKLKPSLAAAGLKPPSTPQLGADYWDDFVTLIRAALDALT